MSNSDVFDLDALVPASAKVKFGNQEIEIQPPKTADVLRLGFLGQKMENAAGLADNELEQLITDLTAQVHKIIPELQGRELNTAQLLKLVQLISSMAIPPDSKELEERGISVDDPKKTA